MAVRQDTQLEKVIEELSKSGNLEELDGHLQRIIVEGKPIKCTKHFLSKLDKLMCMSLDQHAYKAATLSLNIIGKHGKHLQVAGGAPGLIGIITQGLVKKWFEKCRKFWVHCGPDWSETSLNLCEDFLDTLLEVHGACNEGTYEVTEFFLYLLGQLAGDARIYILIRKEAIRKLNIILDKIPAALKKKKILSSKEASDIMINLAAQLLDGGDYDFQTALTESLCRMAPSNQRKELADQWFSISHVASAFVKICDTEFETDCRKFLNLVNGMQGDMRRVYSYPCLETFLDKHELLMPMDDKLEEFWIDFNLGSRSISFYFCLDDDEGQEVQWETMCIIENEVESYAVIEKGKRKVLQMNLSYMVDFGSVEGSSLSIQFSSSLDILQAACSVFGKNKQKAFIAKRGSSVVKTEIRIQMVEDNSQAVVPESQVSLGESQNDSAPFCLLPSLDGSQTKTPATMRNSQSTTFIKSTGEGSVHKARALSALFQTRKQDLVQPQDKQSCTPVGNTLSDDKSCSRDTTPSTERVLRPQSSMSRRSKTSEQASKNMHDKYKRDIPFAKAVEKVRDEQLNIHSQEDCAVPDTQPKTSNNTSTRWRRQSVSEVIMMPTQKMTSLQTPELGSASAHVAKKDVTAISVHKMSVPNSGPINQKLLHTKLKQHLRNVTNERDENTSLQQSSEPQVNIREQISVRDSVEAYCSTSMAPQKQKNSLPTKVNGQGAKGNVTLETEKQASTNKSLQKKTARACRSKEKRNAEVSGNMVKIISSHYDYNGRSDKSQKVSQVVMPSFVNRLVFNTSWSSAFKMEQSGSLNVKKSRESLPSKRDDVFAFNVDTPTWTEGKRMSAINAPVIPNSDNHKSSSTTATYKKGQQKKDMKRHLFSDTDTDNLPTDVSWLKESGKRQKITKYSRQAAVKPKVGLAPCKTVDPQDLPQVSPKSVKGNPRANKKTAYTMKPVEQPNKCVKSAAAVEPPHVTRRRPQRAAASFSKSYREVDTDDSQSASDYSVRKETLRSTQWRKKKKPEHKFPRSPLEVMMEPSVSKKYCVDQPKIDKKISEGSEVKKSKTTDWKLNTENQSDAKSLSIHKLRFNNTYHVATRMVKTSAQEQTPTARGHQATRRASLSAAPSIEKMRYAERSTPNLALTLSTLPTPRSSSPPASPDHLHQDSPSPILQLPKLHSSVSSRKKVKSFYGCEKTTSIHSMQSLPPVSGQSSALRTCLNPSAAKKSLGKFSPPRTPVTSRLLYQDKPHMPSPPLSPMHEAAINRDCHCTFNKVSSVVSLSQSSCRSSAVSRVTQTFTDGLAGSHRQEKTHNSNDDRTSPQSFASGPCPRHPVSSSESEAEQRQKCKSKARSKLRIKPRKLFKPFNASAEAEMSQVVSSFLTVSPGKADGADEDFALDGDVEVPDFTVKPPNLCQQLNFELKKKCQMRCKMMELYNQQSLKTVQQHVSFINVQVHKDRTQRIEEVEKTLVGQIQKLEREDLTLKTMEKDLTTYWKKQSISFLSYREQETKRNETLKTALQGTMCHSLEYEERIFTSQMDLIRKDMKSVQDRLMTDMQEKEIQSIKQGLHTLFFPGGGRI